MGFNPPPQERSAPHSRRILGNIAVIGGFDLASDQIQLQTARAASFVAPSALHASNFAFV